MTAPDAVRTDRTRPQREPCRGLLSGASARLARPQRGVISVEFGLLLPVFLIVVAGTAHLGRLVFARHQVANATDVATRLAVVTGAQTPGDVQLLVEGELEEDSPCDQIVVQAQFVGAAETGMARLEVETTCVLAPIFGGEIFDFIAPGRVSATSVMPL